MRRREREEPRTALRLLASTAGDSAVRLLRQDTGRAAGAGVTSSALDISLGYL